MAYDRVLPHDAGSTGLGRHTHSLSRLSAVRHGENQCRPISLVMCIYLQRGGLLYYHAVRHHSWLIIITIEISADQGEIYLVRLAERKGKEGKGEERSYSIVGTWLHKESLSILNEII